MSVEAATAKEQIEHEGARYYFCSAGCRSKFEKDPGRYTPQVVQVENAAQLSHPHVMSLLPGGEMEREPSLIDPGCGMTVDPKTAEYRSFQNGDTYYFCSAGCKESFDTDPAKYIRAAKK
jgi:Cu+-exporting ATPase